MLNHEPGKPTAYQVTNRQVVHQNAAGRQVVVTDSIIFGTEADKANVLVTAGHTGRSGARHIINVHPFGFICSDGARQGLRCVKALRCGVAIGMTAKEAAIHLVNRC